MGVEVVRDLAHDPVNRPFALTEAGVGHPRQLGHHVLDGVLGRRRTVVLPHDHGHAADLAVGHPAHVVLVVPLRQARRLAEVAAGVERERHAWLVGEDLDGRTGRDGGAHRGLGAGDVVAGAAGHPDGEAVLTQRGGCL